ncbi:unnamed protein product [Vicia faba]|uniref:Pentatricopeptide repeat-containing protein n=1 Tax=Vicia faba TaxID=3906 RepID=A0AAV0YHS0_VICFA|nr:unnamed protein product [Vicia faba]
MHSCYTPSYAHTYIPFKLNRFSPRTAPVRAAAVTSTVKRTRKKKQPEDDDTSLETSLRFSFMEELMNHARNRNSTGVSQVMYDMIAAGLSPGPRSFHGLVVSYALNGDEQAAMDSLRRELGAGLRPIHETFIALVRWFGSKGQATRDANRVFLKGAKGGLRATDEVYDLLIVEDCKVGDHSNALEVSYEMEAAGRMATTFHFNCLLSVQATCGIPEIAFTTFENMEYGEDYMKPDTETYNWVIQAYTRADSYDRVQDVAELLGMMVEDHKRIQPNVKTHALLVECFTKYCVVREAMAALGAAFGSTHIFFHQGKGQLTIKCHLLPLSAMTVC